MAEGVAGGFVVAAEEVYVEDIFPGASAQGAGLDLTQADVAESEDAQRFEQRSGLILQFEGDGSLVGAPRNQALIAGCGGWASLLACDSRFPRRLANRRLANQEEAG